MRSPAERTRNEILQECLAAQLRRHQQQNLAIEWPTFVDACVAALEEYRAIEFSARHLRSAIHVALQTCGELIQAQRPGAFGKACCALYVAFRETGVVLSSYATECDRAAEQRATQLEAPLSRRLGA